MHFHCLLLDLLLPSHCLRVEGFAKMEPDSAEFIHHVVEASKLAFADREAYCKCSQPHVVYNEPSMHMY